MPDAQDTVVAHEEIRLRSAGMGWPFRGQITQSKEDCGDGWFYPRDLPEKMPDGSFALVGRSDFLLNFGGVKFSPERPEADISKRFGLQDVAVVAGVDAGRTATVLNIVHTSARAVPLQELQIWENSVHPSIRIGSIRVVSLLPRTTSNKLDRIKLKSLF